MANPSAIEILVLILALLFRGAGPQGGEPSWDRDFKIVTDFSPVNRTAEIRSKLQATMGRESSRFDHDSFIPMGEDSQPVITRDFHDVSLKEALMELSSQVGIPIITAGEIEGVVDISLKGVPLNNALEMLTVPNGYDFIRLEDRYIVGAINPDGPDFRRISITRIFKPRFITSLNLAKMLPDIYQKYITSCDDFLVIMAPPMIMQRIEENIQRIDIPPRQISVDIRVLEVPTTTLTKLGIHWAGSSPAHPLSDVLEKAGYSFPGTVNDLADLAEAMAETSGGRVSAKARVLVQEGMNSEVWLSEEHVSGLTIKTGLTFTGYITANDEIVFKISPQFMTVGAQINELVILDTIKVSTQVRGKSGEAVVLGGFFNEEERTVSRGIPILSSIPFFGEIFKGTRTIHRDVETVIIITPAINN